MSGKRKKHQPPPRAVVLRVVGSAPSRPKVGGVYFCVHYRILKRGSKPHLRGYILATDELDAMLKMTAKLRKRGFRI